MGRRRKDDSQGLPSRVYLRCGSFYYVHLSTGKWENLGRDLGVARKRAEHYNDPAGSYGTMAWFLDQFIIDCGQRVAAKSLSQRTLDDYVAALKRLKANFGDMLPCHILPAHINDYLADGVKERRPVPANREKACLSSCISWMIRSNIGGIQVNPCLRGSGIVRNPESRRERYVTHEEYRAVFEASTRAVRLMMELVYRTLQRPEVDVLAWTPANVRQKDGGKVLHFRQKKTGRLIDIGLVGELGTLVADAIGEVPVLKQPIVHDLAGNPYTYDGLSSMLKAAQERVRYAHGKERPASTAKRPKKRPPKAADGPLKDMPSFGFRDLKGKGATDMWLAGVPIEQIQHLCGHADKATTEIYIKARWRETAAPNNLAIGA